MRIIKILKMIGIVFLVLLVIASWIFNIFGIVFYILGFYTALYFLSILFKTTVILDIIITIGGIILYPISIFGGLFLLYLTLKYMFEVNFFIGFLFFIFGIPLVEFLFFAIVLALGAPILYFQSQLEEKFEKKNYYY